MWKRFIRALKSLFGGLVSSIEDPKLILEQNIREMNDQVPKMNENIATVKANVLLLQKEVKRYEKAISEYTAKIKSAINVNRDDIAESYALQLEKAKENIATTKEQLNFAEQAYDKALQVKKAFMREKDKKIREAREALRASERAEWQSRIADTLEQFEVTGVDATHDEMINRINEETARNEARMEIALDSIDTQSMQVEVDAEKFRASELVKQFKREMNLEAGGTEEKPKEILDTQKEKEESPETGKTIGKERSKS
ncbi:MAG TPA: PspA/IM30 family protein [Balneolales bacterium]|nr:PspA/IM30 family protein [Balneolales bacterium]